MNTVELFCGTKSFSKVMEQHGFLTETVDNETDFDPGIVGDVRDLPNDYFLVGGTQILWASPPCTAFSVASIGTHWGGGWRGYEPKTKKAKLGIELVQKTLDIIKESKPTWWFIENPRDVLRKLPLMQGLHRVTVWYCRYGDTRAKPTDIWTNATWWKPREVCKNGHSDHERAPRGAKTGTQGLKGAKDRGRIPPALFEEILSQMPLI